MKNNPQPSTHLPSEQKSIKFSWDAENFLLDGKPVQFFSGEIHYQRIPREYWQHRLKLARAMGLNAVAIYMFWNKHEPRAGEFDFAEMNAVAEFVKLAQQEDLWVILRPGPYCCAEWDFGGLPPYLLKDGNMRVRCMYSKYIKRVEAYVKEWSKHLEPLQCTKGGPIVMVQVENEYGSYGSDKKYLRFIKDTLEEQGFEVPLFTCDGPSPSMLDNGTLPELLCMVNFGNNPRGAFSSLENFRKDIPHMCCEYYPGWFTHWGNRKSHHTNAVRVKQIASQLEWMITHNKSWNLYMFHGGTNFDYTAGANFTNNYKPDITSYDYSSPVREWGEPSNQYFTYRELLKKYQPEGTKLPEVPKTPKIGEIGLIEFGESAPLFENLPEAIESPQIHSMEYYNQFYGYILYRKEIHSDFRGKKVRIKEMHDYAHVFVNGKKIATLNRANGTEGVVSFKLPRFEGNKATLDILVESHGRVNYGSYLLDRKGISQFVSIDNRATLMNWEVFLIETTDGYLNHLNFRKTAAPSPAFHRGTFTVQEKCDTFLDMRAWKKGMIWVNGRNLGRYWDIGPQRALYLPGPWLNESGEENQIILLEMEGTRNRWRQLGLYKWKWGNNNWRRLLEQRERPPIKGLSNHIL